MSIFKTHRRDYVFTHFYYDISILTLKKCDPFLNWDKNIVNLFVLCFFSEQIFES